MNRATFIGRLTKDPEVTYTQGQESVARVHFTLAVQRRRKSASGEAVTDFIPITAWRKTAETIGKYLHKGSKILVECTVQTGQYEKDGKTVYTTDFVLEDFEFLEPRNSGQAPAPAEASPAGPGFVPVGDEGGLPFN